MSGLDWTLWAALIAYIVLAVFALTAHARELDKRHARRKARSESNREIVMARLIFEHKSGSDL
jgi:hypothetical protein